MLISAMKQESFVQRHIFPRTISIRGIEKKAELVTDLKNWPIITSTKALVSGRLSLRRYLKLSKYLLQAKFTRVALARASKKCVRQSSLKDGDWLTLDTLLTSLMQESIPSLPIGSGKNFNRLSDTFMSCTNSISESRMLVTGYSGEVYESMLITQRDFLAHFLIGQSTTERGQPNTVVPISKVDRS